MNFALLNNQLTEEKDLRLTNKNRGFLYGDGFFETIKIFNKKPFNLENHFDRIIYSADLLDIKFTLSFSNWKVEVLSSFKTEFKKTINFASIINLLFIL